ncbi:MAG: hemerythrin family protein [Lachnospiraceae bacterium]|nr:hemerythrin family protein [Lachnospiraceae bacterium]
MFHFTEDCILGMEEIDNEHRHLFDLINQVMGMVQSEYKGDQYSDIKELLDELEEYADMHFAHEEAYMEEICDPELIIQRPQHMFFRESVMEYMVQNIDDDESQQMLLEELMHFLAKWLYHHILGSDIMIGKLPPLEEWMVRENPCEFTEEYMTGLELIDNEHQLLFELVERMHNLVRSGEAEANPDEAMKILKELKQYTKYHFTDEEEYMTNIGYEGLEAQKRAHEAFIHQLDAINKEDIEANSREHLESLVEFLLGWLIHHILQADKKIPGGVK